MAQAGRSRRSKRSGRSRQASGAMGGHSGNTNRRKKTTLTYVKWVMIEQTLFTEWLKTKSPEEAMRLAEQEMNEKYRCRTRERKR